MLLLIYARLVANVRENFERVRERVAAAAHRAGRDEGAIRIVAVTKTLGVEALKEAVKAGITDLGENRVQEALPKIEAIRDWCAETGRMLPTWHLVGHLQSNKVRAALGAFDILQSLDSVKLARAIEQRAEQRVPAYIEVNIAGEESKFGFVPGEVGRPLEEMRGLARLDVVGLMTVAPLAEPGSVRTVFRRTRELAAEFGLQELSMGMTGDFEIAVEEGATCLRLGRVLFGERQQ
ncbi:MAG: YggS family pyridoxal phosphate-dependent enzyme [Dehalococcoidia bacterium]|nr:YggS family pyridoxal phosphate-dependent enzyme [Dehalococcoidia bacterium]